ncbi:hypothetical protein SLS62_006946 [Diatrype stigma]|uniref:NADH:flavin oxidoreductase/NADH oxidase N-terminal domain-containing protein n=1 Tax=Diatrype stigma TaxID=117547 RepID=A0AAN9UPW8_9PEZI
MPSTRYSSEPADASALARPLIFRPSGKVAKNVLMKSAMAEAMATWSPTNIEERGIPTKELIEVYRIWGEGANSYGMILTGNIDIEYDHLDAMGDMIITGKDPLSGPRFEGFQAIATAAKANGSLILAQVTHPGRQVDAKLTKESISASALQLADKMGKSFAKPREATQADIDHVVASFVHAAEYLAAAGFDGMELHSAHGYLLSQFLSRTTNRRTDAYGGSVRNRTRILVEIARGVRSSAAVPADFMLGAKLNSVEFQEDGLTTEEARELCAILQDDTELDFLELSGGTYEELGMRWERESTRRREAYFLEFADLVVPGLGPPSQRRTKVYITGGLRTVGAMVRALDVVDGVGIGRPATQEPRFANDLLEGRITGAIKPFGPLEDMSMGLPVSGTQIVQTGDGEEPFDTSDEAAATGYLADLQKWAADLAADGEKLEVYKYPKLTAKQRPLAALQ